MKNSRGFLYVISLIIYSYGLKLAIRYDILVLTTSIIVGGPRITYWPKRPGRDLGSSILSIEKWYFISISAVSRIR